MAAEQVNKKDDKQADEEVAAAKAVVAKPVKPKNGKQAEGIQAAAADVGVEEGANGAAGRAEQAVDAPRRRQEYLIAHTRGLLPAGSSPFDLQLLTAALRQGDIAGVEVRRTLNAPAKAEELGLLAAVPATSREIIVAAMDDAAVELLQQQPQLEIEPNLYLELAPAAPTLNPLNLQPILPPLPGGQNPGVLRPLAGGFNTVVHVQAADGTPQPAAEVYIFGSGQHFGVTDAQGNAAISLAGENTISITGLYIKPKGGFWDRWIARPAIDANAAYVVSLRDLSDSFIGFPDQEVIDWGFKAMKIDQLTPREQYSGAGIKVAVVDSGAAAQTHRDIKGQVKSGFNILTRAEPGWDNDEQSHGTHCAGVIAGAANGRGIRGIAPKAELVVYKIFPGGQFDHLIDALDRCIQEGVDIVNLSLGADQSSARVEEWLAAAKQSGVACIVAAGNSSGAVKFPASSKHVLAVAAIGQQGTFPVDSFHANQLFAPPDANGYFSARFSCFGPEVAVCAPGVAVLSSVPDDSFAAWDGTSMAGPHVAGLAALILAHHPDFQRDPYKQRNAQRVDRLFEIIKASAMPLNLGGALRTGAGLPDAVAAFRQSAPVGAGAVGAGATGTTPRGVQALFDLWK